MAYGFIFTDFRSGNLYSNHLLSCAVWSVSEAGCTDPGCRRNNASGAIDSADAPDPAVADQAGSVWIAGRVGIGSQATDITHRLQINDNTLNSNVENVALADIVSTATSGNNVAALLLTSAAGNQQWQLRDGNWNEATSTWKQSFATRDTEIFLRLLKIPTKT